MLGGPQIRHGFVLGTGSAITVELGFIPDWVIAMNVTDGDIWHMGVRQRVMAFTSGGTTEIVAGMILQGATSTAVRCKVEQVILVSGTWAGGDAAGYFLFTELNENGTFGSENVDLLDDETATVEKGGSVETSNVATVTAQSELGNSDSDTAVAAVTPANGITPYKGSAASAARGFTMGSNISESGKLIAYLAIRSEINRQDVA